MLALMFSPLVTAGPTPGIVAYGTATKTIQVLLVFKFLYLIRLGLTLWVLTAPLITVVSLRICLLYGVNDNW